MADLSLPIKLACVLFGVGYVMHMIGFCSPFWLVHEYIGNRPLFILPASQQLVHTKVSYGIWKYCVRNKPVSRKSYESPLFMWCDTNQANDYVRAVQFFETVGLLASVAAIVLLMVGVYITSCRDKRIFPILSAISAEAAAGCIILGCIIFGAKFAEKPDLSWAFALAVVGGIFHGLAGVLIFVATLR